LSARSETIEEVVAAVGKTPLLASDVRLAELVGLVPPRSGEPADDYRSRLLDARINLELQFLDLETSGTLYRLDVDVTAARSEIMNRAGGDSTLEPELAERGLTLDDVDQLSLRSAAARAYIEQRLRPRVRVTDEEVQTAYYELVVREAEASGQSAPPIEPLRSQLRRLLTERKLTNEIEKWLEAAAEQHEVTRFDWP
jgi:hypothetical protein